MDLSPKPTHIIMQFAPRQMDKNLVGSREDLFRASDGMMMASRVHTMVQFGENPATTQQRHFIDEHMAKIYLRSIAMNDMVGSLGNAVIEFRDAESKIAVPAGGEIAKFARN